MRILLVDDAPHVISDILMSYDYHVEIALNGHEALSILDSDRSFQLVILDITMPGMNGWQTLEAIRKHKKWSNIHILMLTASNSEDSLVHSLEHGADEYLTKPISVRKLIAHIKAITRRLENPVENEPNSQKDDKNLSLLTVRENEILQLVVQGFSNQQIAQKLTIAEVTVKNHVAKILGKLGVQNRTQAAYYIQSLQVLNN